VVGGGLQLQVLLPRGGAGQLGNIGGGNLNEGDGGVEREKRGGGCGIFCGGAKQNPVQVQQGYNLQ
jgi:hypothetical protein